MKDLQDPVDDMDIKQSRIVWASATLPGRAW
jgi:hypothetical protein